MLDGWCLIAGEAFITRLDVCDVYVMRFSYIFHMVIILHISLKCNMLKLFFFIFNRWLLIWLVFFCKSFYMFFFYIDKVIAETDAYFKAKDQSYNKKEIIFLNCVYSREFIRDNLVLYMCNICMKF